MYEDIYGKENKDYENVENKSHYVYGNKRNDHYLLNFNSKVNKKRYDGTLVVAENAKLYVILGWISAALTFFISPLFAVAGIAFGILLNRQIKGSGNTLIIANVAIGLINLVLGVVFVLLTERMLI